MKPGEQILRVALARIANFDVGESAVLADPQVLTLKKIAADALALERDVLSDLYEALEQIVSDWDGEPEDMYAARAALAKARRVWGG